jgi:hypothetical protein
MSRREIEIEERIEFLIVERQYIDVSIEQLEAEKFEITEEIEELRQEQIIT